MVAGVRHGLSARPSGAGPTIALVWPPTPAQPRRRRPRRGSPDGRSTAASYRGTWLLVALPAAVAAFSVARPPAAPGAALPPDVRRGAALALAEELARLYPDRAPGTAAARRRGRAGCRDQMQLYGFTAQRDRFTRDDPGPRQRPAARTVVADRPGRSTGRDRRHGPPRRHRRGPGRERQRLRHGALIELARAYATPPRRPRPRVGPPHTLVFLSTDGGAFGGLGAARFAAHADRGESSRSSTSTRSPATARRGSSSRATSPARRPPTLVATAAARIAEQTGSAPRPDERGSGSSSTSRFPFSLYEQAPVRRPRHPGDHADDRRRPPAGVVRRHARAARPRRASGRSAARRRTSSARSTQGLELARGTRELRLPRRAARPRLGDRVRARRGAAAVPRRDGRPLRPLPPAADPARARAAQPTAAGSASGSGPARSSCSSRCVGVWPGRRRAAARARARPRPATGRCSARRARACSRRRLARGAPAARCRAGRSPPRRSSPGTPPRSSRSASSRCSSSRPTRSRSSSCSRRCTPGSGCRRSADAAACAPAARARRRASPGPLILLGSFAFRFGLGLDAPWYLASSSRSATSRFVPSCSSLWLAGRRRPARGARRRPLRAVPERRRAAAARADPRARSRRLVLGSGAAAARTEARPTRVRG